jgi:putative tryptophan/tyrosine transport system substrate-binding protein
MKAIVLIMTLALGLLVAPLAVDAQPPTKVHRVGFLLGRSLIEPDPTLEAFRKGLRDLGYIEGQNLVIEARYAEGSLERLRDLAAELVQRQVDVMVTPGGAVVIRAAQHATRTIPIVMVGAGDPVAEGFVVSLARPGGNITGLSLLNEGLPGKRLELLKEAVPQSMRVAVLANPASPTYASAMHTLTGAAQALGLQLHTVEVHHADELDTAFAAMTRAGADALLVIADPLLINPLLSGRIADLAAQSRLPAMYSWKFFVEAGGLISYGPNNLDVSRHAAIYVDKILKGAKPADLPVEQPTKFELIINLKAAKQIGLTIPPNVLARANKVIK